MWKNNKTLFFCKTWNYWWDRSSLYTKLLLQDLGVWNLHPLKCFSTWSKWCKIPQVKWQLSLLLETAFCFFFFFQTACPWPLGVREGGKGGREERLLKTILKQSSTFLITLQSWNMITTFLHTERTHLNEKLAALTGQAHSYINVV